VRPTHLLHLAWEGRHGYFWEALENLDWVCATLDLLRLFHAAEGVRVVCAGSCAEYDWQPEGLGDGLCRERATPCRPFSLYGLAKANTHDLIAAYAARSELSYAWGRAFLCYGPFETGTRLVPSIISALMAGRSITLGNGRRERDFLDVRDVGKSFAELLCSSVEGPINIGSGQGVTFSDVAFRLAALLNRPEHLVEFGVGSDGSNDPMRLVADVTRLRDEVGFSPDRTLDEGLADTVAWWRSVRGDEVGEQ
jgi:nucleoside-diphosphate-sugar epimerase